MLDNCHKSQRNKSSCVTLRRGTILCHSNNYIRESSQEKTQICPYGLSENMTRDVLGQSGTGRPIHCLFHTKVFPEVPTSKQGPSVGYHIGSLRV